MSVHNEAYSLFITISSAYYYKVGKSLSENIVKLILRAINFIDNGKKKTNILSAKYCCFSINLYSR